MIISDFLCECVKNFQGLLSKDIWSLLIFGVCIVLFIWDKLPMATTAILGCVLMILTGAADFKTAFGQFASSTVILLIGVMIVGSAIAETGVAAKIGRLITKFSGNSERGLLLVSFVLSAVLSTFLTNATILAIFMPIIVGMSVSNKKINPLNLIIPITLASNLGGISTLVGSSQQMTAQGLLEEIGMGFRVFDFTPIGIILSLVGLLYCLFIGYPLGKKIWGDRDNKDCEVKASEDVVLQPYKAVCITIIFAFMVISYIFLTDVIPIAVTAMTSALACIITGCIPQKKAFSLVNWNILWRLAGCLGLAKCLESAGGTEILAKGVKYLIGDNMSPFILFAIIVFLAQAVSLVISNSTAILISLPIIISLAPAMGLSVPGYAMGIVLSSSMGMCCPLSGSTWGISMSVGYKFKDYFKYGIAFDLLAYVLIIIFVPIFFPLTV